jgi:plastocyanin
MDDHTFLTAEISIKKGGNILLINDSLVSAHPLQDGSWKNGTPQPLTKAGAPKVDTVVNGGGQTTIGPFTTAGTYHIYCTAHPGMQLTVMVQ